MSTNPALPIPLLVSAETGAPAPVLPPESLPHIVPDLPGADQRAVNSTHLSTDSSVGDPNDLTQTGWCILFASDADPAIKAQLQPLIDLRHFLGSGVTPISRNTRILVANHREIPAGLLVDEVLGFRRFAENEFTGDAPPTVARCERYLAGAFRRGHEQWPVLSLRTILESQAFSEAAA